MSFLTTLTQEQEKNAQHHKALHELETPTHECQFHHYV
jgi:hypothetical protein